MDARVIRKPELFSRVGLSDATIWRMEKAGKFPKRIGLGGNSVGWLEHEISEWFEKKQRIGRTERGEIQWHGRINVKSHLGQLPKT